MPKTKTIGDVVHIEDAIAMAGLSLCLIRLYLIYKVLTILLEQQN